MVEVGYGNGAVLAELARRAFGDHYWGLEIRQENVDATRDRSITGLQECRLYEGLSIPYQTDSFDLVVLTHVVEHLENPRTLITEAARAGRAVLVEVPLEDTLRLPLDYVPSSLGHINYYSSRTIRHLLQTCDLRIVAQQTTNPSREVYEHRMARRSRMAHAIKQVGLRTLPGVARRLATYHETLLAIPAHEPDSRRQGRRTHAEGSLP